VLFPNSGPERWKTMVLGSLADGILDAAVLLVYEKRFRPEEKWHAPWQQRQQAKIDRALEQLEKSPPAWSGSPDYGHLTLACALGYLDFRHEGKWRAGHPKLVALARSVREGGAGLRRDQAKGIAAAWRTFQSRRLMSLSGIKRTWPIAVQMSAYDCGFNRSTQHLR
jgi:glutathione S-transferase